MKAVCCVAPGRLSLVEVPAPDALSEGWALVEVSHVGICGTDYHIFEGKHPFLAYPRIMGHEVSGTILAANGPSDLLPGSDVIVNPYLSCGNCHACRIGKPNCCSSIEVLGVHRDGAMAEQISVPLKNLYPAQGLSPTEAACVEFLAIGAHGVRRSLAATGAKALVIGAGPIGLGAALFARVAGQRVTVLDLDHQRIAFAEALGFEITNDAFDLTDRFEVVYDATGSSKSMVAAFRHVEHGGVLVLLSVVQGDVTFSDPEFHKREMMLIGSRNATALDFDHVVASIRAGLISVEKLVTHRTSLEHSPRDIALWAREKSGLIKAVIDLS